MTKGQKFQAINDVDVLYTYKLGGGLLGRKVKKGDIVTFLTNEISFSTRLISCYEILRCMSLDVFEKNFKPLEEKNI